MDSDSSKYLALVFLLPFPAAFVMWLRAFPISPAFNLGGAISSVLIAAAMVISLVAFSKALGSQYEVQGRRSGLLLSFVGVLAYLLGTSLQSGILHLLSVAVFYWGCVLFLGGLRPLISTVPGGLLSVYPILPNASSLLGLPYLEVLTWVVIFASVALLLNSRRSVAPWGCRLCAFFKEQGEAFCLSCGRLVGKKVVSVPRRRTVGLAAFAVAILVLLTPTIPLLSVTPSVSFVNYGLGGAQSSSVLPVQGSGAKEQTFSVNGHQFRGYLISVGKESVEAYVAASGDQGFVSSILKAARGNSTGGIPLPPAVGQHMSGYSLTQDGVPYVGIQGAFLVGTLNGSGIIQSFVAVDLKEAAGSFNADNGTALYAVATSFTGWAISSGTWFPYASGIVSTFQLFTQLTYFVSFATVVVILFTIAREDELAKVRRHESSFALSNSEAAVLGAFPPGSGWRTGEQAHASARSFDPYMSDSDFYSALEGVLKRDLVRRSIFPRDGRPTLLWRSSL